MKPLTECIRNFIMTFPELKDGCLMIDYLGDKAVEYSVESVPCDKIVKRYADGGCMKQFLFLFASREFYHADINELIDNSDFYEKFEDWIFQTTPEMLSPFLDGRCAVSLHVLTAAYLYDTQADTARYQIQLQLIYED